MIFEGQENHRLAMTIKDQIGAKDFGTMDGFFNVAANWLCPSCFRNKTEIARLHKNGNLFCRIVEHHDHFSHFVREKFQQYKRPFGISDAVVKSCRRFPDTMLCDDCNTQEGQAKLACGTLAQFSFTPFEIGCFIRTAPNAHASFDTEIADTFYKAALPALRIASKRVLQIAKDDPTDTFEQVGDVAMCIVQELANRSIFQRRKLIEGEDA